MPDQIYEYPAGIRRKFVDQGDGSYAERVSVGGAVAGLGVLASNGTTIYPDGRAKSVTRNAAGKIATETFVADGVTYVKTYLYDANARYAGETDWVAQ